MGGNRHVPSRLPRTDVSRAPLLGAYAAKQCPVRTQNDVLQPVELAPVDEVTQRRFDAGYDYEAKIFAHLRAVHAGTVTIDASSSDDRIVATVAAMRAGVPVILNGQLPHDEPFRRTGRPDILLAAPDGGYRAIDVKSHLVLDRKRSRLVPRLATLDAPQLDVARAGDAVYGRTSRRDNLLQLAHYQRMLYAAGFAAPGPAVGAIVGTEGTVCWFDLDAPVWREPSVSQGFEDRSAMEVYDVEFAFRLEIAATSVAHLEAPGVELLVDPVNIPECESCPWSAYCAGELERVDDVSLLPGIGWKQWKTLRDAGIRTRSELATLTPGDERVAHVDPGKLRGWIEQARAWVAPEPFSLKRGVARFRCPRGDIELDIDLENAATREVYLWGVLVSEAGREPRYESFASWEPMNEEREVALFLEFWRWLGELRADAAAAGKTVRAYSYAIHETVHLRKLGGRAGISDEVEAFIAGEQWIDLHKLIAAQIVTGTNLGLKLVAPLAGFTWDGEDAGGEASMLQHEAAVAGDLDARAWLLTYNRNDVEATLAIREALTRRFPENDGTAGDGQPA